MNGARVRSVGASRVDHGEHDVQPCGLNVRPLATVWERREGRHLGVGRLRRRVVDARAACEGSARAAPDGMPSDHVARVRSSAWDHVMDMHVMDMHVVDMHVMDMLHVVDMHVMDMLHVVDNKHPCDEGRGGAQ